LFLHGWHKSGNR